jgi:hypothetical protein
MGAFMRKLTGYAVVLACSCLPSLITAVAINPLGETSEKISVPAASSEQYQLFYILHADHGAIASRREGGYQLILQNVQPYLMFRISSLELDANSISLSKFFKMWQSRSTVGRSDKIKAELTSMRGDKSIEQQPLSQEIILTNSHYDAKRNEVLFEISFLRSKIPSDLLEAIDEVNLFIDGCQLCECRANTITCE